MLRGERLPRSFLRGLAEQETAYLAHTDPIRQSGFSGGPQRWREEREPILDAVEADGDLLDIGCANGYLLECLVSWARDRGLRLVPHGLDQGARLIELARERLPEFAPNFYLGNSWEWTPSRRFRCVYTLCDCVPPDYLGEYVHRPLRRVVAPGGRLIVGSYGSRSRAIVPLDVAEAFRSAGLAVVGESRGGRPPVTAFAWVDSPGAGR